jgi:hypothetical protein
MANVIDIKRPDPFAAYAVAVRSHTLDGLLLKFAKGDWLAGPDGDLVEEGTQLVAIMSEFKLGWQKWEDHKPVDDRLGRLVDHYTPPPRNTLGDTDQVNWEEGDDGKKKDPWQRVNQLPLIARQAKTIYTFVTSTRGGIDAVAALCEDYAARANPGRYPIVALGVDSYLHSNRSYGRVKIPTFEVIEYVDAVRPDRALVISRGASPSSMAEIEAPRPPEPSKEKPKAPAWEPDDMNDPIPF